MHRHARNGLAAAVIAAVIAVPAYGWYAAHTPGSPDATGLGVPQSASGSPAPSVVSTVSPTPRPSITTASASPHPKPKAVVTARPTAARSSRPAPVATFAFPVPVALGDARQVITVQAHGSYASVAAWELRGSSWHLVLQTRSARVGTNGVVPGGTRMQGTGTTPGGTYTLTQAFGIATNPGTTMPYHQVTSDDWWVEDNSSPYYNQMRTATQGGFNTLLPPSATNGSEHLITYPTQYQYVVVVDFNRWPAVRYRGAGIFLHVNGAGSTAGCVSVPQPTLVAIMRWLNPAAHPRIAIA